MPMCLKFKVLEPSALLIIGFEDIRVNCQAKTAKCLKSKGDGRKGATGLTCC